MHEMFVARQIALTILPVPQAVPEPVQVLTDSEWVNRGLDAAAFARYFPARLAGHRVIVESLIPGVRTLAMLFASRRCDGAISPASFSDDADWMAARILLFGAAKVVVTAAQLPVFDMARRRLMELAAFRGVTLPEVVPVLATGTEETPLLSLWSADIPSRDLFDGDLTSFLDATLLLQQHFSDRTNTCLALFA